jgi:acyl carrier protein
MKRDATRDVEAIVREVMHGRPIGPDEVLADSGFDSVGVIALLAELEEHFGFSIPGEEITPESFRSKMTNPRQVAPLSP